MTDKQQIEELRKFLSQLCCISNCDNCKWRSLEEGSCLDYFEAEALFNANYRQVPPNAVVLTQEEYNALMLEQKRLKEIIDRIPCGYELKDKTRKETAKEIYITGKHYYYKYKSKDVAMNMFADWIKETFGLEVDND